MKTKLQSVRCLLRGKWLESALQSTVCPHCSLIISDGSGVNMECNGGNSCDRPKSVAPLCFFFVSESSGNWRGLVDA